MSVRKQTVRAEARSLADAARDAQACPLAAEVARRLALPLDAWEPAGALAEVTGEARARLAALRARAADRPERCGRVRAQDEPQRSRPARART